VLAPRGTTLEFAPLLSEETMALLYRPGNFARKASDMLSGCFDRARWALREAPQYDVVVIFREALLFGVDWIERYLTRVVPTVFDFDDAVWLPNVSAANRRFQFLKGFDKVNRILAMVSGVSAGCEYLASHARRFNSNVFVVPTSIDLEKYGEPRTHEATDVLTVGWTGSVTTGAYLQLVAPALRRAAEAFPMRLRVIGAEVEIPGVDVQCEPWTPQREVPAIRAFDVGLKPSPREEWVRGKCPMKDIQYMTLGVPPVATDFGTAGESIRHGASGFLCNSDDDWVAALDRLRDVEERRRIGRAARTVVEERYSSTIAAAKFDEALHSARERFHRGASRASA
jgi:glycosyltransferase involved in cell wall biosynthesis